MTIHSATRWLVVTVALTLAITGSAWLQWHVRRDPETAQPFVGPLPLVVRVFATDFDSRAEVDAELNRLAALGYDVKAAAGGIGSGHTVMQRGEK